MITYLNYIFIISKVFIVITLLTSNFEPCHSIFDDLEEWPSNNAFNYYQFFQPLFIDPNF
uniref:Uncharacterized protein n=1 Tax=Physcomitrium patens TaxID=3218 RepID=A0A2K1KP54_PHYPA|nr:hypothetical protein PHYPA_006457 [Physcomitrium patens]